MFNNKGLDDLAQKLSQMLPPGMGNLQKEMQKSFKTVLSEGLKQLDLVTREEFDVQVRVLLRTREKLEALEKQVEELEKNVQKKPAVGKAKPKKDVSEE